MSPVNRYFSFSVGLFFTLCVAHAPSYAQRPEVIRGVDSCRALLAGQSPQQRMATYAAMQALALYSNMEYELDIARDFEAEAIALKDIEAIGQAKYRKVAVYFNYNETDKCIEEAQTEMEQCRKVGAMQGFYLLVNLRGERILLQNRPLAALNFVTPLFEQARENGDTFGMASCADILGQIYLVMGDLEQSEQYLREAIEFYTKLGSTAVASKLNTYFKLSNTLLSAKKYEQVIALTLDYEALMERALAEKNGSVNEIRYALCFFLRGVAAYNLGDKAQVDVCYSKMGHYTNNGEALGDLYSTLKMCADAGRGDFAAAHLYADQQIATFKAAGMPLGTLTFLQHKADFYSAQSKYKEAADMLSQYIVILEKARQDQSLEQQNEFSTLYELEKKEAYRRFLTSCLVGVGVACLLLGVALGLFVYFNRLLRRRNHALCEQIAEVSTIGRKMEQMRNINSMQGAENGQVEELSLAERLDDWMRTRREFTNAELSRDTVASELATNRTYLSNAIREAYNQTFTEYLTSQRLNAAVVLIEKNRANADMQVIALEVGYNSYTSFYRSFVKKYGVKPLEYVHFLNKKEILADEPQ